MFYRQRRNNNPNKNRTKTGVRKIFLPRPDTTFDSHNNMGLTTKIWADFFCSDNFYSEIEKDYELAFDVRENFNIIRSANLLSWS